jgi:phosphatidate phosphatase APP1
MLKRKQTGDRNILAFDISKHKEIVWSFVKQVSKKHNDYYLVRIMTPQKSRTDNQRKCLNGWIQFFCTETGNDFYQVKMYVKKKAISRGYPMKTDDEGNWIKDLYGDYLPQSEAEATVEQSNLLIEEMQQLAAEYSIKLPEKEMFS